MNKELIEELKVQDFNVVAVSKTRTKEEIDEVAKMGLTTFGENRVQEFIDKYDPKYTWHIIGHLQTNKVKYIVGNVDFYGNTFKVNKNTLIPRFETELLVEKTIKYINKYFNNEIKILDIGTGSGCIAITLYKLLDNSMVTAVDISKDALDVARENNKINNVRHYVVYNRAQSYNKRYKYAIKKARK